MGYTSQQQARLDAAQQRLDNSKAAYRTAVNNFDAASANVIPCYTQETFYGVSFAERGDWKPKRDKCTRAGACTTADKNQCQNFVDQLNSTYIPALQAAYRERNDAQANYDRVLAEVQAEVQGDPDFIHTQTQIQAEEAAEGLANKQKWIFAGIVVLVIGGLVFAWFRWGKKLFAKTAVG